jgi:hypothetical protein
MPQRRRTFRISAADAEEAHLAAALFNAETDKSPKARKEVRKAGQELQTLRELERLDALDKVKVTQETTRQISRFGKRPKS